MAEQQVALQHDICVAVEVISSGLYCIRHAQVHCNAFKVSNFQSCLILVCFFYLLEVCFCFLKTVKYVDNIGPHFSETRGPHDRHCVSFFVLHFS